MEYPSETLNETLEKSWNESNWHQSKLFSCSQIVTFFEEKKKKSISYGCMGTDQLKDNEDYHHGWTAQSRILSHYEMIQCEDLLFLLL